MTFVEETSVNKLNLNLTQSTAGTFTFTYKVLYPDGLSPEVSDSFTITITIVDCAVLSLPTDWVSDATVPAVFA